MQEQERKRRLQDREEMQHFLDDVEKGVYDGRPYSLEDRAAILRNAVNTIFTISHLLGEMPDPGSRGEGEPFTRILRRLLQASSGPCATCRYYCCSYCGNCHNPYCRAYQSTCSDTQ